MIENIFRVDDEKSSIMDYIIKNFNPISIEHLFYQGSGGSFLTQFNSKVCYIGSFNAGFNSQFSVNVYNNLNLNTFTYSATTAERFWHIDNLLFWRIVGTPPPVNFQFVGFRITLE